jgi:hypothetical protein
MHLDIGLCFFERNHPRCTLSIAVAATNRLLVLVLVLVLVLLVLVVAVMSTLYACDGASQASHRVATREERVGCTLQNIRYRA